MPPVKSRPWAVFLVSIVLLACGGGSSAYRASYPMAEGSYGPSGGGGAATGAAEYAPAAQMESLDAPEADSDEGEREERTTEVAARSVMTSSVPQAAPPPAPPPPPDSIGGEFRSPAEQIAQADTRRPLPQAQQPRQAPDERSATDATQGPLLIYQAVLHLAVYQVQDNQRAVVTIAREMDGFLSQQSDTIVVIRVPARRFQEALGRIEALGDVLHRNIQATDVSEEFRDTQIRLRNLEQVRDRLAALLAQARTVEESLQIERELERLTTEIESMKGRLRFLEDRIAFSTITVNFSPREQETLQGELFNLPFDFLYNLGLRTLLNLR